MMGLFNTQMPILILQTSVKEYFAPVLCIQASEAADLSLLSPLVSTRQTFLTIYPAL